jgi:iron(II)-dependent oxidoreductase
MHSMQMVDIPPGQTVIGTSQENIQSLLDTSTWAADWVHKGYFSREQPQHVVFIDAFKISKYPVMVGEFREFIHQKGYTTQQYWTRSGWDWVNANQIRKPAFWDEKIWTSQDRLPVVGVSWYEAAAFCRWLSDVEQKTFSLPTEFQWERAARGNDDRIHPWGNKFDAQRCNTRSGGKGKTTLVGSYSPGGDSRFGCCDMIGNVSEWTRSLFLPYPYREEEGNSLEGSMERVSRGGSWHSPDFRSRVNSRGMNDPFFRDNDLGFRVVCLD